MTICVCRFCPNTFNRPKHSHRFTCDVCQRRRKYESARRSFLALPVKKRRAIYRHNQQVEKARHLKRALEARGIAA